MLRAPGSMLTHAANRFSTSTRAMLAASSGDASQGEVPTGDPANGYLIDLFLAQSFDGGTTWQQNLRLSTVSTDARLAPLTRGRFPSRRISADWPSTMSRQVSAVFSKKFLISDSGHSNFAI